MPNASDQAMWDLPVPLVRATGSRYDVGFAHGRTVSGLVDETLDWSFRQLAGAGVERLEAMRGAMEMLAFVERATPELVQELTGIAEGAGLTLAEAAVINSRYELMLTYGNADRGSGNPECTIFGIEGVRMADGRPVIGQNVDLSAESRGLWIILDITPDDAPRIVTATLAGMLAQEGLNDAGLALCGSMVRCDGWRPGYPSRKFLRRKVLEQTSVADAICTVRAREHRASSHNLMLADKTGRVVDVETTVDEVRVLEPTDGMLVHANHYLAPGFQSENAILGGYLAHTCMRFNRMNELLQDPRRDLTLETLMDALRDHHNHGQAICRHSDRDNESAETNLAIITEPVVGRTHLAFGPPCETRFIAYTLSDTDAARYS